MSKPGKRILLIMPTFWDIIAPAVGIVALKSFLEKHGHAVKTVNLNEITDLWNTQKKYFDELLKYIPHKGLIPRTGAELLGFHLNAAVFKDEHPGKYSRYIEILFKYHFEPFLTHISTENLDVLTKKLEIIIDEHFNKLRKVLPLFLDSKPEYVGCSTLSSTLGTALFILREIKNKEPHIKTILGGPGPYNGIGAESENLKRLANKCSFIDKIVFGESELILKEYIEQGHEGDKIITAKSFNLQQIAMDSLPYLDYSDLNLKKYFSLGISSSRGCPFTCSFCSETTLWGGFRRMSVERVVNEVKFQMEKNKINKFFFTDALFNHSITAFTKALLDNEIKIEIDCYLRIDRNTEKQEITDMWSKGGLRRARIGMESASPDILTIMSKGITPEQQEKGLKCLSNSNIKTTTYWIVGHPHETEENFQDTLNFIKQNKNHIFEVDLAIFYFYGDGEIGSGTFVQEFGGMEERFPSEFDELSIVKYYKLKKLNPSRQEAYDRAIRFVKCMEEEGIPCNRSSVVDLLKAEKRWQKLRENNSLRIN